MDAELTLRGGLLAFALMNSLYGGLVLFSPDFRNYMQSSLWKPTDGAADWFPGRSGQIFDFYVRGLIPFLGGIILALIAVFVL